MEFVEGRPLMEASAALPIAARLRLFQKVLAAVSYAHSELVVHRDIKPANILVTHDGEPKLLDFGIARLTEQDPSGTVTMNAGMTPDYASPEQVKGEPFRVGTDIYSLGATLYEILTGARPHGLETYSTAEIYRCICEQEIRPPSERAADPALRRQLRGDLDTLVLHAMAKEPAARFPSAEAFRTEIDRYLEGRPLAVRPASAAERTWKFVRRNRITVAAAIAVAASLIAGTTVSTIEARRAQRRFAQVRELANTFLFQFYDQVTPLPGSTALRASIVDTARKYLDGLAKEAGSDTQLILELAQAYQRLGDVQGRTGNANLGQVDQARRSYRAALELYGPLRVDKRSPAELRLGVARALLGLGRLELNVDHEAVAEIPIRKMVDLLSDATPDAEVRRWHANGNRSLGEIRLSQGNAHDALQFLESAQQELKVLQSSGYNDATFLQDLREARIRLAKAKAATGDLDGTLKEYLDYVGSAARCDEENASGSVCRDLGVWLSWAGDVYGAVDRPNLGEPDKAAALYERALRISEHLTALDANDRQARFDLAARCGKLGDVVWQSDPRRALDLYEQALKIARALVSQEQFDIFQSAYEGAISRPLIQLGRFAEARRVASKNLEIAKQEAQNSYADLLGEVAARLTWARLLIAERKQAEAQSALQDLIRDTEVIRTAHPQDLSPTFYLAVFHRLIASITTGQTRRDAFLASAAIWRSWPGTSFTRREEQKDLAETNR
jgi:tetratricopeptide (TPR) repeat protein